MLKHFWNIAYFVARPKSLIQYSLNSADKPLTPCTPREWLIHQDDRHKFTFKTIQTPFYGKRNIYTHQRMVTSDIWWYFCQYVKIPKSKKDNFSHTLKLIAVCLKCVKSYRREQKWAMYENVFHTNYNSFIFLSDVHVLVMIMEMIAKLGFFMFLVTVNETKQPIFGFAVN